MRLNRVCLLSLMLILVPVCAGAAQKVPERLVYSLSWTGIPVGTATQEIFDEGDARKIRSSARSNAWLSAFFPVDDRTESVLEKRGRYADQPRSFKMLFKEGSRVRDREIHFDQSARSARFYDRIKGESRNIAIEPDTFDIYSSFYHVRHQQLEPGKSIHINVLDSKKLHRIEVRVLRKERITVPAGVFDTVVIEPMVKPVGVFEGKRGAYIWLSDDDRRVPVKAETRVTVGSVTAVLTGGAY